MNYYLIVDLLLIKKILIRLNYQKNVLKYFPLIMHIIIYTPSYSHYKIVVYICKLYPLYPNLMQLFHEILHKIFGGSVFLWNYDIPNQL